ncbi:MAG TPA: hypothetical protein VM187_01505 [Niastella sp.]|nr:hypothetical protein [Niastella sp.]
MTKRTFLLTATIILSCCLSMKATSSFKQADLKAGVHKPAFAWNFIYAFGNGPVSGLSWSGDYLYISSGTYVVYSANGYGILTPSNPVYCNAAANANTYVQLSLPGSSSVSFYDFQQY